MVDRIGVLSEDAEQDAVVKVLRYLRKFYLDEVPHELPETTATLFRIKHMDEMTVSALPPSESFKEGIRLTTPTPSTEKVQRICCTCGHQTQA